MIKQILLCVFMIAVLNACKDTNYRQNKLPDDKAILVGKITLSQILDESGKPVKNTKYDVLPVFLGFSSPNVPFEKDAGLYKVATNKYFAIVVDAGTGQRLNEIQFIIEDPKPYLWIEYKYHTYLTKKQFVINTNLKPGNVYSLGNIKIELADISFKRAAEHEIGERRVQYIIPKDISLDSDLTAAQAWFYTEFPMIDKTVKDAQATVRTTDWDNTYQTNEIKLLDKK